MPRPLPEQEPAGRGRGNGQPTALPALPSTEADGAGSGLPTQQAARDGQPTAPPAPPSPGFPSQDFDFESIGPQAATQGSRTSGDHGVTATATTGRWAELPPGKDGRGCAELGDLPISGECGAGRGPQTDGEELCQDGGGDDGATAGGRTFSETCQAQNEDVTPQLGPWCARRRRMK